MRSPLLPSAFALLLLLTASAPDAQVGLQLLSGSDSAANDSFGYDVAVSGGLVLVGAPDHDDLGASSGAAYLFQGSSGQELFKLLASDGASGDRFGTSVGIDGSRAVVGSPGGSSSPGKAYVFDVSTGQQVSMLHATVGPALKFGGAVAISGSRVVIGGLQDEDAYVFDADTGLELHELVLPASPWSGWRSVAIDGDRALVSRPGDDEVYVFDVNTGVHLMTLAPPVGFPAVFGYEVSLDGDLALVSGQPIGTPGYNGAAFLFDVTTGQLLHELQVPGLVGGADFGSFVDVQGDRAVVSAFADCPGSAYVFDTSTGLELFSFEGFMPECFDSFGYSVSLDEGLLALGAYTQLSTGKADVFDVSSLHAAPGNLSVSAGGSQAMTLSAGAPYAGQVYLVAGTLSGTMPGTPLGSLVVPLNFDAYTQFSIVHPNEVPLVNTLGTLDAAGAGTAAFSVPASLLPPSLAGTTIHHAYVVVGAGGAVSLVSNAEPLLLEP